MTGLDIWLGGQLVARTEDRTRGRKVRIAYDESVAEAYEAETPLLSCSLPTPGPSQPANAHAFLEGLLPEGRALQTMAAGLRGVRLVDGALETPSDVVALLGVYGRECAGAVVVVPAGEGRPASGRHVPLDAAALAGLVTSLPEHPLGNDLEREVRMSLAGAQPKRLLARVGGAWCEPVGGAASTHILKPTTVWPNSAENEALVMTLARSVGLTDRDCWVEHIAGTSVLVAERYDRTVTIEGRVTRHHQEDMCQALGLRPAMKYDMGRPSGRMARLLRERTDDPQRELRRLFSYLAFRAIVGDADGHGKNYSLLLDRGAVTLAPIYDCLCTLAYPDLSGRMAAPIGQQQQLAKVSRAALLEEAAAMGIPDTAARAELTILADSIQSALDSLDSSLTDGWDGDRVVSIVQGRVRRLTDGDALGGPHGAGLSLDAATAQRTI